MKKRAVCILIFCIGVVFVGMITGHIWIAIIFMLFFMITLYAFALRKYSELPLKWEKQPNLLQDKRRNFDIIYIGDLCQYGAGLDLTVKYSNLYSDYLLLQRYYSLLSKTGRVIFNIKANRNYMKSQKLSWFVLGMLHPVTLLEHGKVYYNYVYKWEELFTPLYYIIRHIVPNVNNEDSILNKNDLVDEIKKFACDRSIKVEFWCDGKRVFL